MPKPEITAIADLNEKSLPEVIELFLKVKRYLPDTHYRFELALYPLVKTIGTRPLNVETYAEHLQSLWENGTPMAYRKARSFINTFFNWSVMAGYLDRNIDRLVSKPQIKRKPKSVDQFVLPAEYELLKKSENAAARWIFILGWSSGQRLSDLCMLEWDMVDLVKGEINWDQQKTGGDAITIILPNSDLHQELVRLQAEVEVGTWKAKYVCPKMATMFRFNHSQTSTWVKTQMLKCGVKKTAHCLRHSLCSRLMNSPGVSIASAMAITGHKDVGNLLRYVHRDKGSIADAQLAAANFKEKVSDFPRAKKDAMPLP